MAAFYSVAAVLCGLCLYQLPARKLSTPIYIGAGLTWILFFILSLVVITVVVSSYIYAMPYHHCPFCILKAEYHGLGYPIFLTLFLAVFSGISHIIAGFCNNLPGLAAPVRKLQTLSARCALAMLCVFVLLSSYHFWAYILFT